MATVTVMRLVTGLTDQQLTDYELHAELATVEALQKVADTIADRIGQIQVASARVRWDGCPYGLHPAHAGPCTLIAADDFPDDGLPPGQPYVSPDDLAAISPLWAEAAAQTILPVVAEVWQASSGSVYAQLVDATNISALPSVGSLAAEQYLAQAANTFAEVGDDLWATARTQLLEGFEQGESIPQLAARVRGSAGLTAKTATLVARTQVLDASNAGSYATAQVSGLDLNKGWLDTPDLRTRPSHRIAGETYGSDDGMIPFGDQFTVGGFQCDRPHDPGLPAEERYNCRCTLVYSMPERAVKQAVKDAEPEPPLPGTSGVDDIAAQQSAEVERVFGEVDEAFKGLGLPPVRPPGGLPRGIPSPQGIPGGTAAVRIVRPAIAAPRSVKDLQVAFRAEVQRVTGRDVLIQLPDDVSLATMKQYAEGVLTGMERFPDTKIRQIAWWYREHGHYAEAGADEILFNRWWSTTARRPALLKAVRGDVAGWETPGLRGWMPRGSGSPDAIGLHEFGHTVHLGLGADAAKVSSRALTAVQRRAALDGVTPDELISREMGAYASSDEFELVAGAFTDAVINGQLASPLSREIYALLEDAYRAGGKRVGITSTVARAVPAPKPLARMTVAELRTEAGARGVVVPAGARKADIVRLLDEGVPRPQPQAGLLAKLETSLTADEQARVTRLVNRDPQIFATVQDRFGSISTSGNLDAADAAWLQRIYQRDRAFVERAVQDASIKQEIADAAKKAGQTPTEYRAAAAAKLKDLLDDKPIAVRVRDEAALRDIISGGRFKTQLEGAKRAPGLGADPAKRRLGEQIQGVPTDLAVGERPVYGYVAIGDIEPALSAGRRIPGIRELEGQEDVLSSYGRVQVVLKPEVRARTTATVGDSLDEIGFLRPSPVDAPTAESLGFRTLDDVSKPGWTRRGYVEAQIHGGVRADDIAAVVFAEAPNEATIAALTRQGIPWRVLGKGDSPLRLVDFGVAPTPTATRTVAQLRALAKERGIVVPPGIRKPDLVRLLDEGAPAPPRVVRARPGSTIGDVELGPTVGQVALGDAPLVRRPIGDFAERAYDGPTGVVLARGEPLPAGFKSELPAIRRGEFELRPGLTADESRALDRYALSRVADPLNTGLREGRTSGFGTAKIVDQVVDLDEEMRLLDSAIDAGQLARDTELFRGALMRPADIGRLQVGAITSESGYLSTATEMGNAFQIINWRAPGAPAGQSRVVFKILTPKGTRAGIGHIAEHEVLLARGRRMRVVDILRPTQRGDTRVITLELLPDVSTTTVTRTVTQSTARQKLIDKRRQTADFNADTLAALLDAQVDTDVLVRTIQQSAARNAIPKRTVDSLVTAARSGDPAKVEAAIARISRTGKVQPLARTTDIVAFDPKTMQALERVRPGQKVRVIRPGHTADVNGEQVQLSKSVVEVLSAQEIRDIEGRALRAAARETNRLIEARTGTAKLLAEVDELISKGASKATIAQRLDVKLVAPEQIFAGADPAVVKALADALASGDMAKLRSAITRAGTKAKIKPISRAGAKAKFDPDLMEPFAGDIPAGAQVVVVTRGSALTLPDGTVLQLTKARVQPVPAKAAAKFPLSIVKPVRTKTARAVEIADAKKKLPSARARLRDMSVDNPRRADLERQIAHYQAVIDQKPGPHQYNWSSPSWDEPASAVGRFVTEPTTEQLAAHVDSIVGPATSGWTRSEVVHELNRQAAITPRTMASLRTVGKSTTWGGDDIYAEYDTAWREIRFSPKWSDRGKLDESLRRGIDTHFHPPTGGSVFDSVTAHEYGHHVTYRILEASAAQQRRVVEAVDEALRLDGWLVKQYRRSPDLQGVMNDFLASYLATGRVDRVSGYAKKNYQEFFAEVWSEFTTGNPPRPHIRRIGEMMRDVAESVDTVPL
jgi:hypothetical protein